MKSRKWDTRALEVVKVNFREFLSTCRFVDASKKFPHVLLPTQCLTTVAHAQLVQEGNNQQELFIHFIQRPERSNETKTL